MIANAGGDTAGLTAAAVGLEQQAFFHIVRLFRRSDNNVAAVDGMRCGNCGNFLTWNQIMDLNYLGDAYRRPGTDQFRFRRFFIWGIALHALTDTFEHSASVPFNNAQWRMIPRPIDPPSTTNRRWYDENVALVERMDAAQAAVWEALHVLARLNADNATRPHGCCHVFLAIANPRANTPVARYYGRNPNTHPSSGTNRFRNFRLANLMDYISENSMALYGPR